MDLNELEKEAFLTIKALEKSYDAYQLLIIRNQFALCFYLMRDFKEKNVKDKQIKALDSNSTREESNSH